MGAGPDFSLNGAKPQLFRCRGAEPQSHISYVSWSRRPNNGAAIHTPRYLCCSSGAAASSAELPDQTVCPRSRM